MASLGELTAGIAHEIQNPLNFVNNFSELNTELLEELKAEKLKAKEERDELVIEDLLNDIKGNEEKVRYHGKRAETIVKGMLQHSRTTQGEKELTDINVLAHEYLRLAYHGLRAKDKTFNAEFKTDLDQSLPKLNVFSQDMGRVLLNLINNAFYAVNKKAKEVMDGYKPLVIIRTKKLENLVKINVIDNGPGISAEIKDKIFQPFFTTKPTGQGTGLGLSLSYDIIKAHGGEIRVETKVFEDSPDNSPEETGTQFIVEIPIAP
jgi:signal transduction histidine kinase